MSDHQIKVIRGTKYRVEKIACPFVSNTFYVTGGWGPWMAPNPTGHLCLDGVGTGKHWNKLQMGLDGVIVLPNQVPLMKGQKHLNKQGFVIKCDSGEYIHYQHCDLLVPLGTRVKKYQKGVGIISPDSDGSPNWQGPHLEYRIITSKGLIQIHPFDVQDRSARLYASKGNKLYETMQYGRQHDTFIYTSLGKVKENEENQYYTVKRGGWISNVVNEIIQAGIWEGPIQKHINRFYQLNHPTPKGGYRAGYKVRIK